MGPRFSLACLLSGLTAGGGGHRHSGGDRLRGLRAARSLSLLQTWRLFVVTRTRVAPP